MISKIKVYGFKNKKIFFFYDFLAPELMLNFTKNCPWGWGENLTLDVTWFDISHFSKFPHIISLAFSSVFPSYLTSSVFFYFSYCLFIQKAANLQFYDKSEGF